MSDHDSKHGHVHQSHEAIIKRLKRADGHLRSIIVMLEEGRGCVDVAQQLHAVEKAVLQAKRTLIQDHVDHCLEAAIHDDHAGQHKAIDEFKEIVKYL